ncbi:histidine-type phosphatase [Pantoea stewartii]|uniref:histidine-type phosphatase n=1 Tax=Pantoea stewartii TaxID=66269 RepID=UPI0025A02C3F|nr:histidine-type phosphatase [Pantoea stewartii]
MSACSPLRVVALCALWFVAGSLYAAPEYQLEKVVELSRHGVRPPTPGNRQETEAATGQPWPRWSTADGELTGHGYSAVVNKARWEGDHYRQLGLLPAGCPDATALYVRASPLQRTRATAEALVDGAFPGCGVAVHTVTGDVDPLFQTEKLPFARIDPQREMEEKRRVAGDLAQRQQQLQPAIQALKQAVCAANRACPFFDRPWQLKQTKSGSVYVEGLSTLAAMVETLRLGYSENLPFARLAWGHITSAQQITALLPLLTASYDLSNDVLYMAQRRGSLLLQRMLDAIQGNDPDVRWVLLVAHDTNIAMVRRLMGFEWQLPGYTRGNIPPGSSLVMERWRDTQSNQRYLRVYFQAQSLDGLRQLQPINDRRPLLRQEWQQAGCHITDVGTLCPLQDAIAALGQQLDRSAIVPESLILPAQNALAPVSG